MNKKSKITISPRRSSHRIHGSFVLREMITVICVKSTLTIYLEGIIWLPRQRHVKMAGLRMPVVVTWCPVWRRIGSGLTHDVCFWMPT